MISPWPARGLGDRLAILRTYAIRSEGHRGEHGFIRRATVPLAAVLVVVGAIHLKVLLSSTRSPKARGSVRAPGTNLEPPRASSSPTALSTSGPRALGEATAERIERLIPDCRETLSSDQAGSLAREYPTME